MASASFFARSLFNYLRLLASELLATLRIPSTASSVGASRTLFLTPPVAAVACDSMPGSFLACAAARFFLSALLAIIKMASASSSDDALRTRSAADSELARRFTAYDVLQLNVCTDPVLFEASCLPPLCSIVSPFPKLSTILWLVIWMTFT